MTDDSPADRRAALTSDARDQPQLRGRRPDRPRRRQLAAGARAAREPGFRCGAASRSSGSPNSRLCARPGRSIKDHTLEHLDFYLELYESNVLASGGKVHWAATPQEACAAVLQICRSVDAKTVTKGKSMVAEEIGLNDFLEAQRHHAGRDRSRRVHHPAAPRAAEPYHRAGHPSGQRTGRGDLPGGAPLARPRSASRRAAPDVRRGARDAAAAVSRRRCRHYRRQFSGRGDRVQHHRHKRRQRRPDPDLAAGPYRRDEPRKARPDIRGRGDDAASSGALGDRPGVLVLHDDLDRTAPRRAISTAPSSTTSCCSTTGAAR